MYVDSAVDVRSIAYICAVENIFPLCFHENKEILIIWIKKNIYAVWIKLENKFLVIPNFLGILVVYGV